MDISSIITQVPDESQENNQHGETSLHDLNDNTADSRSSFVNKNKSDDFHSSNNAQDHTESTFIIGSHDDDIDEDPVALHDLEQQIIHSVPNDGSTQYTHGDASVNEESSHVQPKPRPKRFFNILFCCFGYGQRPSGPSASSDNRYVPYRNGHTPQPQLLSPALPSMAKKMCAVIDLDETLVHSSFKFVEDADFVVDVEIEGFKHQVYVLKRPYVDEFLTKMGELYECVLFTASLAKYADPVSDLLDETNTVFKYRLFREACVFHNQNYVKDLARLGRTVDRCVIIDNSPASYMFNKENAIQVKSWFGDREDTELKELLPYMEKLAESQSVSEFIRKQPPPCPALNFDSFIHDPYIQPVESDH